MSLTSHWRRTARLPNVRGFSRVLEGGCVKGGRGLTLPLSLKITDQLQIHWFIDKWWKKYSDRLLLLLLLLLTTGSTSFLYYKLRRQQLLLLICVCLCVSSRCYGNCWVAPEEQREEAQLRPESSFNQV